MDEVREARSAVTDLAAIDLNRPHAHRAVSADAEVEALSEELVEIP
jgi:hypothetical protein